MKNLCGIYSITNIVNNKIYIGQSRDIKKRWKDHKRYTSNSKISKAIFKYGIVNFIFEILECCEQSELNDKEVFYIEKFDSIKTGYNIREGGNNGNLHDRTKKLISESQKLRYRKEQKHFVTFSGGKQKAKPLNITPKILNETCIVFSDYQKRRIFSHMFTPTYNDNQINPELWDINGFDKNMTIQALL